MGGATLKINEWAERREKALKNGRGLERQWITRNSSLWLKKQVGGVFENTSE